MPRELRGQYKQGASGHDSVNSWEGGKSASWNPEMPQSLPAGFQEAKQQ